MCEFCTQHGEGKKWYLKAENYATELLDDLNRRDFIRSFYDEIIKKGIQSIPRLERLFARSPGVKQRVVREYTEQMKKSHFGQVLPKEDVHTILSRAHSIVRMTCACRWETERKEGRSCFGISFGPPHWYDEVDVDYFGNPDVSSFEKLTSDEAKRSIEELDGKGMVHSVWTFQTPFIGAVCNCDMTYCLAMKTTCGLDMPTMFRAEVTAEIGADRCKGCRACVEKCQFAAIRYDESALTCVVDQTRCFGCGVCRSACEHDAIVLMDRAGHPVSGAIW